MRVLTCVFLLLPSLLFAQYDSSRRNDGARFIDGVFYTYTSPLRWKPKDWIKLGGVITATTALTFLDQPVRDFWSDKNCNVLDGVNVIGNHYGKPYTAMAISGGFYTAGLLFKNKWARETGLVLTTALFSSGLLEMTLKPLIGRARPEIGAGNYDITFLNKRASYHSFPSGHASMAFTISFVMAKRVESVPLKILFYSLAGSTAVCRLYSDAHWISDVAFGAAIGWFSASAATHRLQNNRYKYFYRNTKWTVTPYPGGLSLRATFK